MLRTSSPPTRRSFNTGEKLHSFDTALPQEWWKECSQRFGINPVGEVVWCYDVSTCFGAPVGVTLIGAWMVQRMQGGE